MTDKERIIAEIERLKLCTMDEHMKFYCEEAEIEYNTLCKVINLIKSLQEEPVCEELNKVAITAADEDMQGRQIMEESDEKRQLYSRIFRRGFKAGANWQKDLELTWEDIHAIAIIEDRLIHELCLNDQELPNTQEFYEEVLKRFKTKKNHVRPIIKSVKTAAEGNFTMDNP